MIEPDTIKLLRECDAGCKMGVQSIDDVLDRAKSPKLRDLLYVCKTDHEKLDRELQTMLEKYRDDGKDANFFAEKMAKLKTEVKLQIEDADTAIADLMTDGCNMGVKSLIKYLNQYAAAEEKAKDIAKRLIALEEGLAVSLRDFL